MWTSVWIIFFKLLWHSVSSRSPHEQTELVTAAQTYWNFTIIGQTPLALKNLTTWKMNNWVNLTNWQQPSFQKKPHKFLNCITPTTNYQIHTPRDTSLQPNETSSLMWTIVKWEQKADLGRRLVAAIKWLWSQNKQIKWLDAQKLDPPHLTLWSVTQISQWLKGWSSHWKLATVRF